MILDPNLINKHINLMLGIGLGYIQKWETRFSERRVIRLLWCHQPEWFNIVIQTAILRHLSWKKLLFIQLQCNRGLSMHQNALIAAIPKAGYASSYTPTLTVCWFSKNNLNNTFADQYNVYTNTFGKFKISKLNWFYQRLFQNVSEMIWFIG